ncbi:methyl-accepting chemotaxis protein [Roseibium aestuarii]|uniref:Methyl-accepting chemotaxis protein n=1 Tax=Roseibium aestuarii TaxID=2600299 RepID=A0ABW4JTP4_9HYPH|nr:HAMP domain-containing methyl-accepting chemotaxis protein [Roseibium aestuarii]
MRFVFKVSGSYGLAALLTAGVGAIGVFSIFQLQAQSNVSALATDVMAQLQKSASQQQDYLGDTSLAKADLVDRSLKDLQTRLTDLQAIVAPGSDADAEVKGSLEAVNGLQQGFSTIVSAVTDQNRRMKSLLGAMTGLEENTRAIVDQVNKVRTAAQAAVADADAQQSSAGKLERILIDLQKSMDGLEGQFKALANVMANPVSFASMAPGAKSAPRETQDPAQASAFAKALVDQVTQASALTVKGVNASMLADMKFSAMAVESEVAKLADLSNPVERSKLAQGILKRVDGLAQQSQRIRTTILQVVEKARDASQKVRAELVQTQSLADHTTAFQMATLQARSNTIGNFAGLKHIPRDLVEGSLSELATTVAALKNDAGSMPAINGAVAAIGEGALLYDSEVRALLDSKALLDSERKSLDSLQENVRRRITAMTSAQARQTAEGAHFAFLLIAGAVLVSLAVGLALAWVMHRVITTPTRQLTGVMGRLAEGDLEVDIPLSGQRDEIGDMSRALQVFKTNAAERVQLEAQARLDQDAQSERQTRMDEMIAGFRVSSQDLLSQLGATALDMNSTANSLTEIAALSAEQASDTARMSEAASTSVNNVAGAAEELSASIAEIGAQVGRTSEIVSTASTAVRDTSGKMHALADAASKIGEVVTLIQAIAAQTNLLALNATIEAARAGEAGRGFAVVASEVKELAMQTSRATEEISQQIATIQGSTDDAVGAITSIVSTMEQVDAYTQAIATAVVQQNAATEEISGNVHQAALGTHGVQDNMTNLSGTVDRTRDASRAVLGAAGHLSERSDSLREEIERFLQGVAAA